MSISTVSTRDRRHRKSPASIISSDSDIRFTRRKLSSQTRCGCCIIATFLLFLLLAAVTVYIAYTYFLPEYPGDQVYRATFRVIDGDAFTIDLADPSTSKFKSTSRDYKERLNLLFRRSSVKHGYIGTDVLALDGTEDKDLIVHFDIKIDPTYVDIKADDLEAILANEISVEESLFFRNLTIDANSLEVKPSDVIPQMVTTTLDTTVISEAVVTVPPHVPRKCTPLSLRYCNRLGYNITTYPNILGHRSIKEVTENVNSFREMVDAECYRYAYDFVCQLMQPGCQGNDGKEDDIILPCRSFCREFMGGCGSWLSESVKTSIDCSKFPEFSTGQKCFSKPGCLDDMKAKGLSSRTCDGVIDCADLSDEKNCTYCVRNEIHCGIGRTCIKRMQQCDGREDCPDGSDERACLTLSANVKSIQSKTIVSPHETEYVSDGFVTFNEKGESGKLCIENLNKTLSENKTEEVLRTVAISLCKSLRYEQVKSWKVVKDSEDNIPYVKIKDAFAEDLSFVTTKCPSKQVLKVSCANLECGIQSTHSKTTRVLQKMSVHGDWPWHSALFKDHVHTCDGILVAPDWLATTTSCFQGQPKADWMAKFGVVRLAGTSPWEQERRIVGMVKSPVEGSTIALVRLDQPVAFNDFIRPVCLPEQNIVLSPTVHCTTLGWARNREQLQRVQVKLTDKEKCENVSIANVNSICTETIHGQNDCNEEEFAGSSMVCKSESSNKWTLVGVTNWRIACAKNGTERPRMYDKIASNIQWIRETIMNANNT